ncbi:MAG TPA: prepilin-type N-terminal cleavage/methylation domain-containing protein [Burkholderiales bacterium]
MNRKQQGFTLIEIAIVLVIIGLLLGGILKGQELITSARVRNLISQQDGIKAAFFGFQDRYRALPGDYTQAAANVNGTALNGNGNGQIEIAATQISGSAVTEHILVWDHLSHAGFINGAYTLATATGGTEAPENTPQNPYSMFLRLSYDSAYGDTGTPPVKHNLKSGNQIPADILAEVDRKVDDGNALRGGFRFSAVSPTGTAPTAANCYVTATGATQGNWTTIGTVEPNCGGTSLF